MKKIMKLFHADTVKNSPVLDLKLVAMLLFGHFLKNKDVDAFRKDFSASEEIWLLPTISDSRTVKVVAKNEAILSKLNGGDDGDERAAIISLTGVLLAELGGTLTMQKAGQTSVAKMESILADVGLDDELVDKLRGHSETVIKVDTVYLGKPGDKVTDEVAAAAEAALEALNAGETAGESIVETRERIRKVFEDKLPSGNIGVITVDEAGEVTGDLSMAPPELLALVEREAANRRSKSVNH